MFAIFAGNRYMKIFTKGRRNKMAKQISEIQKKQRILEKLVSLGIKTEEELKKLTPSSLTKDESISFTELLLIYEMQEAVKENRLFSFLVKG